MSETGSASEMSLWSQLLGSTY